MLVINYFYTLDICKTSLSTETSIHLKNTETTIELFNSKISDFNDLSILLESNSDTILIFNRTFNLPLPKDRYELLVSFKNEKIGTKKFSYDFTLEGNESETEIFVQLNIFEKFGKGVNKHHDSVEVYNYLKSSHGIKALYFPYEKEDKLKSDPFLKIQSNTIDTLFFGLQSLLSPSPLQKTINNHRFDNSGGVDYTIRKTPLFPDSILKIPLKNMYWRDDWPKDRYTYTLLYYTKEKQAVGIKKLSEDTDFIWFVDTKKYFRFTYLFEMK